MDQTRLCLAAAFMILAGPLAGCAVIPGTAAMGPPAGPRFDGVYVGQDVLVSGAGLPELLGALGPGQLVERL